MALGTGTGSAAQPRVASGWDRWAPLTGLGFAVLFVVGAVLGFNTPDDNASDREWTTFYGDKGHQATMLIGGFLLVLSAVCLVAFIATVRARIAAARPDREPSQAAVTLTGVGAAGICAGAITGAAVAGAAIFGHLPHMPSADILRLTSNMAFPLIAVAGLIPLAAALALVCVEGRRAGVLGSKMQIATWVAALAALASFMFFPIVLVLIWAIGASIVLLRGRHDAEPTGAGATATPAAARS